MPLPAILTGLSLGRLLLYSAGFAIIGWGLYSVYDAISDRAYKRGVNDTHQAERDCVEGSVCADAALLRAAEQKVVVADAVARAKEDAARAAGVQLEQEMASRHNAEIRANQERLRANAAERRYQEALASNQACAAWAAAPVPCPLSPE